MVIPIYRIYALYFEKDAKKKISVEATASSATSRLKNSMRTFGEQLV